MLTIRLYLIIIFHSIIISIKYVIFNPNDLAIVRKLIAHTYNRLGEMCSILQLLCKHGVGGPCASGTFGALIRVSWQIWVILYLYLCHALLSFSSLSFNIHHRNRWWPGLSSHIAGLVQDCSIAIANALVQSHPTQSHRYIHHSTSKEKSRSSIGYCRRPRKGKF